MSLQPYRQVLALPGVRTAMLLFFFTRLPMSATGITLTLHVVSDLGRGYGEAGLVGTATMLGSALGAPLVGRMIDRYGLRPVTSVCGLTSAAFWLATPHLPYPALLAAALPASALVLPASSIARQVLTALVPPESRRSAYSLDSIQLETTFMIGPSVGIAVSTQLSSTVALSGIGVCFALGTIALCRLDPPIRHEAETVTAERPPIRDWLTPRLIAALLVASGALFCLVGTELATLAALRTTGQVTWTGVVIAVMCVASVLGGIVHGAVRRSLSQAQLMLLLTALVIPVGFATGLPWWLLALTLAPSNLVCAPTLASTSEEVTGLAPPRVRGEAMGLLDSATRFGMAAGSPVVGFVMDHTGAGWGFAVAGLSGLAFAAVAFGLRRRAAYAPAVASL